MKIPFQEFENTNNLLPFDGEVLYYNSPFENDSQLIFNKLLNNLHWEPDVVKLFGKTIITKRKIALYADRNTPYTYSKQEKHAKLWTEDLIPIKQKVEQLTGETYNCCLCNLYHNGSEGMGWHADNEKVLDPKASIASVSFGAERYFHFKHKSKKEKLKFHLENGSLLLMKPPTQKYWLHALPKALKIKSARINLTFRRLKNI